jgi:hypothetical protein
MLPHVETRELDPRDVHVILDVTRFGSLADYQIDRRYRHPVLARERIAFLEDRRVIEKRRESLPGIDAIYGLTPSAASSHPFDMQPHTTNVLHLAHDIALVDLVDFLTWEYPTALCFPEHQVQSALNTVSLAYAPDQGHPPDAVLIDGSGAIGIELEHSVKWIERYIGICRWFAEEVRIAEVWWFTDRAAVIRTIERAIRRSNTQDDIELKFKQLPAGVVVRDGGKP